MSNTTDTPVSVPRIVIVDDHPIVRRGLGELINDTMEMQVCGEASDVASAFELIASLKPDVALIDLNLGDGHGLELVKQIKADVPGVRMLVVSMLDESLYADRVLRAGASGYLRKDQATENIIVAIRHVLAGEVYLSPDATSRVLHSVASLTSLRQNPLDTLSDRELEVFEQLGEGSSSRDIATRLKLSIKTVETYREKIKAKLNLRNGAELTRHAITWALRRNP